MHTQTYLPRWGVLVLASALILGTTQASEFSLAAPRPDLAVKLRFKPGKLTSTAAESVTFYIDVTNIGTARFVPVPGSKVTLFTVNGSGTKFPQKTFNLGQISVGQKVTFQYVHDDLWPVEHCFAKYVRAELEANEAGKRNNIAQITGQSVSDAIAAMLGLNKFKLFGS